MHGAGLGLHELFGVVHGGGSLEPKKKKPYGAYSKFLWSKSD
jgi:hypothetical protein